MEVSKVNMFSKISSFSDDEIEPMYEDIKQPIKEEAATFVEPKTFEQVLFHPNPYQGKTLGQAIRKKYGDMSKRKVYVI